MDAELINVELRRISSGLCDPKDATALYAAQQALLWALDPTAVKSPYDMVRNVPGKSVDAPILAA